MRCDPAPASTQLTLSLRSRAIFLHTTPPLIHILSDMLWLLVSLVAVASASQADNTVEVPDQMSNGTTYSISAFSPRVFVRTDEFDLDYKSCVQFSYKLMERKTRLRAYTCLLSEGGFCTLDKFAFPKDKEGCAYLRPWQWKEDRYSFYFVLERRPRKYGPGKQRPRQRKVRTVTAKPFGQLTLEGIRPCSEICQPYNN